MNNMIVHGEGDVLVPVYLNFGKFILDKLRKADHDGAYLYNCTTGGKLTYKQFSQYAVRLAAALKHLGVGRGDTVVVGGMPEFTFLPTGLAVILTGAAFTPIELRCGKAILSHKINLIKPKYIICTRPFWEEYKGILKNIDFIKTFICFDDIEDIELSVEAMMFSLDLNMDTFEPVNVKGDDLAVILYSSGTTGMSKGILLTHVNCLVQATMFAQWYYDYDSLHTTQPLQTSFFEDRDHTCSYDIFMMSAAICAGKTIVFTETEFDLKVVQDYQVEMIPIVPSIVEMMVKAEKDEYDLSSLKIVCTAGSPLNPRTAKTLHERYPHIKLVHLYGTSETGAITTTQTKSFVFDFSNEGTNAEFTCVGRATPGITIKVVDLETRSILGPNQRGEICTRGYRLMKGYLGSTTPYLDEQGFYLTGDLGYYDEEKRFYLVDRLKDSICYMGNKIACGDVESTLLQHPAVLETAVVGKKNVEGEELPTAFVVLRPGSAATETELVEHVDQQVTWFMQLRGGVRFVSELPRNSRRKVLRQQLKEILAQE